MLRILNYGIENMKTRNLAIGLALSALVIGATQKSSPQSPTHKSRSSGLGVKFWLAENWMSCEALDHKARQILKEKGFTPKADIVPVFDLFPREGVFIRVWYPQKIGEASWYVYFSSDGTVMEVGSGVTTG